MKLRKKGMMKQSASDKFICKHGLWFGKEFLGDGRELLGWDKTRTGMRIVQDNWDWLATWAGLQLDRLLGQEAGGLDQNVTLPRRFILCNA